MNHFLRARIDVLLAGFLGQEEAGTFDHDVGANFFPLQVGRIFFGGQANGLAVHHQVVSADRDVAIEAAMHRIVLQHVGQVVRLQQVVDGNDFHLREVFRHCTEYHATDTTESIDTDFDCHVFLLSSAN